MPCSASCRSNLALIQNRQVRSWLDTTISMLESTSGLDHFTLEAPWSGYEPENTQTLIKYFTDFHASVHARIHWLIRITTSGCRLCRRRQHQEQNLQH